MTDDGPGGPPVGPPPPPTWDPATLPPPAWPQSDPPTTAGAPDQAHPGPPPPPPPGHGPEQPASGAIQNPQRFWMAITALGLALVAGFVLRAVGPAAGDPSDGPTFVVPEYEGGSVQEFSPTVGMTGTALDPLDPDAADIAADPTVGLPAPVIIGENFTGGLVTVPVDGQATILVFLAHWCPHCQAEFPRLLEAWIEPDLPEGVAVVAVPTAQDADSPNWPPSEWMLGGASSWDEPVLLDTADQEVARAMGVTSYPFFVVIAPDGTVAARTAGEQGVDGLTAIAGFAAELD